MDVKSILLDTLRVERRTTRDAIAAMPDTGLRYRPSREQMSFGDQALHIISSQETLLEAYRSGEWNWERGVDFDHFFTSQAILQKFDEVHATEMAYYDDLEPEQFFRLIHTTWGPPEPIMRLAVAFLAHEGHHRGQMVVYLRLNGVTPPTY